MIDLLPDLMLMTGLGAGCALLLLTANKQLPEDEESIVDAINQVLPQTQCAQCGYPGCLPYAQAIAKGEAINRCPPGGENTIVVLADLLGREVQGLDDNLSPVPDKAVVVIREEDCIGCTLCLPACPVDAIVGAPQQLHTVIESVCTGCELCIEPCPVDCIDFIPLERAPIETTPVDIGILDSPSENACINCSDCVTACPRQLQPQLLYWYRNDIERNRDLNLDQCIECRRCDRVCPSELPLTDVFRAAKQQSLLDDERRQAAQLAEQRFIARESRLNGEPETVVERPADDKKAALAALLGEEVNGP